MNTPDPFEDASAPLDPALLDGIEVLSLDAGNTVIFLDHGRLARLVTEAGYPVLADVLVRTEGEAKHCQVAGTLRPVTWSLESAPGARGWGMMVATMLARAGVPEEALSRLLSALWREHVTLNLWSLVPGGLRDALLAYRRAGGKVVIVSNSEGMLDVLFAHLGIADAFDLVIDSGKLGVEKPDPRIFQAALAPFGVAPSRALHLGDSVATDVDGGRAAGLRVALIDPFRHWEGAHADVARVPSVAAVARALTAARATPPG